MVGTDSTMSAKGFGLILVILSIAVLVYTGVRNPILYTGMGSIFLINKFLPSMFILWVLIGMSIMVYFFWGHLTPLNLGVIGAFSIGMVFYVLR